MKGRNLPAGAFALGRGTISAVIRGVEYVRPADWPKDLPDGQPNRQPWAVVMPETKED